jgi:hypothetical protein
MWGQNHDTSMGGYSTTADKKKTPLYSPIYKAGIEPVRLFERDRPTSQNYGNNTSRLNDPIRIDDFPDPEKASQEDATSKMDLSHHKREFRDKRDLLR